MPVEYLAKDPQLSLATRGEDWASQGAMQETWGMWVQSLDQEDPLEEAMTTHSSTLA